MFQQSEVVSLLLALSLAPIIHASIRKRQFSGKRAFVSATFAMILSYGATVVEGLVLPEMFNVLEHALLAVAGVAFAIALVHYVSSERRASAEFADDGEQSGADA